MQRPLNIHFHNLAPSEALEELIRAKVDKLETFYPRLVGCQVAVEEPNHHHRQGKGRHFRVRIERVPGETLIADRERPQITTHEDAYVAITEAFEAARRQLETFAERTMGRSKLHHPTKKGSRPWLRS